YEYGYDRAGRLVDVYKDGVLVSHYDYDLNGNRLVHVTPNGTSYGTYDDQDRMLSYGDATYEYTANGELLRKSDTEGVTYYTYDVLGNLTSVVLPDGTRIDYIIDGQNRRIGKKVNGVLVQGFLYQGTLWPLAELDGAGNIVARFIYVTHANVPDYMVRGGVTYRIICDHLGSPRLVVDATTGRVFQRLDYDEFGQVLLDTNPGFQPFGFAGGIYDKETGLIRFGARDYDARTGRWLHKDPIGFNGGNNFFSYCANDPINLIDPSGLDWLDDVLDAGIDFSAGFSDTITLGLTRWLREKTNFDYGYVDECSGWYLAGQVGGLAYETAWLIAGTGGQVSAAGRFTRDQDTLIQLAKEAKRTKITPEDANTLIQWAKEYGLPYRGPEIHPNRPLGRFPHIHIGPVNHIFIK
ncbi:MAG: RHS repeat-associated core domain-containing protein, partial [Firmicutes bacterium]|nr:RHS repeat-associated core domain-containing protein [Bacillota bacterium]